MHVKIATSNRRVQILIVRHVGDWRQVRVNRCRPCCTTTFERNNSATGRFAWLLRGTI